MNQFPDLLPAAPWVDLEIFVAFNEVSGNRLLHLAGRLVVRVVHDGLCHSAEDAFDDVEKLR